MSTPNLKKGYAVLKRLCIANEECKKKMLTKHTFCLDKYTYFTFRNNLKKTEKPSKILPYIFKQIPMQDFYLLTCELYSLVINRRFNCFR